MKSLESPESQTILSALGWLELGNAHEAISELEQLPAHAREHPDALEVEWSVLARLGRWTDCVRVGESLVSAAPRRVTGWIDRSYALHELRRTREAWDALLPAATKFSKDSLIPYNLACYACVLGERAHTLDWLTKAMDLGDAEAVKLRALDDPDLVPMRDHIRRL